MLFIKAKATTYLVTNNVLLVVLVLISGCDKNDNQRWYSQQQVMAGKVVFEKNCAVCHQKDASGTPDWKETLSDGSLPPPPLNGSAHAWHHSLSVLRNYIKGGGEPFGGKMPAFNGKLSESEIDAAIAYFQSYWSKEIYEIWINRNGLE